MNKMIESQSVLRRVERLLAKGKVTTFVVVVFVVLIMYLNASRQALSTVGELSF